jgi:outer membrane biosynthesis protein TonB
VLQQERTYEELAGLLGISTDAVRERAHDGLERLAPGSGMSEDQRAQVADYLLAQQSVSKREATRALLASTPEAREWAETVAAELRDVASGPLPEIPAGAAPRAAEPEPEPEPVREPAKPEPEPTTEAPAVRARPRPRPAAAAEPETKTERPARERREREKPSTTPPPRPPITEGARSSSSKLGGALLIGGIAIALVAVIVLLVGGGDDNGSEDTKTTGANSTPTATATSSFQPVGQIELAQVGGGKAKGQLVIFASADNQLAFTIQATDMPQSKRGEAYAVWLVGGKEPHRLGFAPAVGADGKFGTSGPRNSDAKQFPTWLSEAKQVVVSRETSQDTKQPGPIVLGGDIPSGQG